MTTALQQSRAAPLVQTARRGAVAEITLASSLNLVTRAMLRQLNQVDAGPATDADLRCVILHGGDSRAFKVADTISARGPISTRPAGLLGS